MRSRVTEVKDLVRTALAHSFVAALQQRLVAQTARVFARWASLVGLDAEGAADLDGSRSPDLSQREGGGGVRPPQVMMAKGAFAWNGP